MAEWLKAQVLKICRVVTALVGSNPTPSAPTRIPANLPEPSLRGLTAAPFRYSTPSGGMSTSSSV